MANKTFRLSQMTWQDVEDLLESQRPVVLLPIGSTEQHGHHLPLGTDSFAAIDLAEAAAEQKEEAISAPPMWYGMSPHHMVLPGTVTIRPEILVEFVYDVVASLAKHGFDKFILINGHRITNLSWMQLVCERVHRELSGCRAVLFDPAYMSKEVVDELDFGEIGHADEIETSHMLVAHPELCHMEKAEDHPGEESILYNVDPRYRGDTLVYVPTPSEVAAEAVEETGGIGGYPTRSDVEKGRKYRQHLIRQLIQVIENM